MRIALINSPSLSVRPVSRSMAGGLGFDGNEGMLLPPLDLAIMAATLHKTGETVDLIDADLPQSMPDWKATSGTLSLEPCHSRPWSKMLRSSPNFAADTQQHE
jgi:hypothetical protein